MGGDLPGSDYHVGAMLVAMVIALCAVSAAEQLAPPPRTIPPRPSTTNAGDRSSISPHRLVTTGTSTGWPFPRGSIIYISTHSRIHGTGPHYEAAVGGGGCSSFGLLPHDHADELFRATADGPCDGPGCDWTGSGGGERNHFALSEVMEVGLLRTGGGYGPVDFSERRTEKIVVSEDEVYGARSAGASQVQ